MTKMRSHADGKIHKSVQHEKTGLHMSADGRRTSNPHEQGLKTGGSKPPPQQQPCPHSRDRLKGQGDGGMRGGDEDVMVGRAVEGK